MANAKTIISIIVGAVIIATTIVIALTAGNRTEAPVELAMSESNLSGVHATVYKSPTCGCCAGHAAAMEAAGITVDVVENMDLVSVKSEHGILDDMQSCHTTILTQGDLEYVVEGHVPIVGIEELLTQQPDIDGIVLPGMPSGTPGMPGPKTGPYNVMTLEETPELFMSI